MRTLIAATSTIFLCLAPVSAHAFADCSAPPAPGVDWSRCFHEESVFVQEDLSGAQLVDARFQRANLEGTNLSDANAQGAKFVSAILTNTNFEKANLREADFTRAVLQGANLSNTNLRRTRFFRANLRGANLSGARLDQTDLLNADISGATWTDGARICAEGSIGRCK